MRAPRTPRRPQTRQMARLRLLVGAVILAGSVLLGTPAAHAHSDLVSADPAQGANLDAAPSKVVLTFTSQMKAPATVVVTAPDGTALVSGQPAVSSTTVTAALTPTTQHGTYTYAFRAFSQDGHQVSGQVSFTVGEASAASPTGSASASPTSGASTTTAAQKTDTASVVTPGDGFWDRHWWQVLIGALLFAGAGAFELAARRSPR
jgi:copper resistance protein C